MMIVHSVEEATHICKINDTIIEICYISDHFKIVKGVGAQSLSSRRNPGKGLVVWIAVINDYYSNSSLLNKNFSQRIAASTGRFLPHV